MCNPNPAASRALTDLAAWPHGLSRSPPAWSLRAAFLQRDSDVVYCKTHSGIDSLEIACRTRNLSPLNSLGGFKPNASCATPHLANLEQASSRIFNAAVGPLSRASSATFLASLPGTLAC